MNNKIIDDFFLNDEYLEIKKSKMLKKRIRDEKYKNHLEDLYYEFSDRCACGWRTVNAESIDEFAEWLDEYEL